MGMVFQSLDVSTIHVTVGRIPRIAKGQLIEVRPTALNDLIMSPSPVVCATPLFARSTPYETRVQLTTTSKANTRVHDVKGMRHFQAQGQHPMERVCGPGDK